MATAASQTAVKALELMSVLGDHPRGATAGQIAEVTGHPFTTAYRLLNTLVTAGYAEYDPSRKTYRLGLRLFQLGQKVAHARGLDDVARPVMQRLTAQTGESSILATLDGDQVLTLCTVDGPQFRTTTDPGDHGPLTTSAVGKVLLSGSVDLIDTVELVSRTPRSITDREALRAEIASVGERGWASQLEENDDGMAAVAVPVRSAAGRMVASLAVAAPVFRKDVDALAAYLPRLREAATVLGAELVIR
ncbi:IclR family transcriptional regulator [Citricoccus sp.]|uniref:IclR family transcriptional regulator n=1 Tax=Citricoccus sp. TaxID=1978372 RepID=UPI0028BF2E33|nr:IclR family transcriptional regulator [Citricoccus sp.]